MAYTPLTTQVAGGTASAAGWANLVKANFESMSPHLIARRIADQVNSTTTLTNDDTLVPPTVNANEVWLFEWIVFLSTTTSDLKYGFTFPSGTIGALMDTVSGSMAIAGTASPVSAARVGGFNVSAPGQPYLLKAIYTCGGTGGTLNMQFAVNTSGTVTHKMHSTLWGVKLA